MPGRANPGPVPAAHRADRRARPGAGECRSSLRPALGPMVRGSGAGTVSASLAASGRPSALAQTV
jgi:hypothetical protein